MGDKMFDQKDKPSDFMPMLMERLREASYASKTPLFQKYFEDLYYEEALVAQFGGDKKKAKEAQRASKEVGFTDEPVDGGNTPLGSNPKSPGK